MKQPNWEIPIQIAIENFKTREILTLNSLNNINVISAADITRITEICNEEAIYNFLFEEKFKGRAYTEEDAKGFVSWAATGWKENKYFVFIIRDSKNNIVGAIDIKSADLSGAEVGYWSSYKTPGLMTNAVIALSKLAKNADYEMIFSLVVPSNAKSSGVLLRAGFSKEDQEKLVNSKRYNKYILDLSSV